MRRAWLVIAVAGCGPASEPSPIERVAGAAPPRDAAVDAAAAGCTKLAFAETTPVPEASGAAWLSLDGKPMLVVVGDSGNRGAYGIVDPDSGDTVEQGKLPLGTGDDDLEGLAARGDRLVGVTSPGWVSEWKRTAKGFSLVAGPYALGPIDLSDRYKGKSGPPPDTKGMVCAEHAANCGRNYEGICLAPKPSDACVGFVAAKADGHLYCLVERDGKLAVDRDVAIAITKPGALADCAFDDKGALYAANNIFDASHVFRIDGWQTAATAKVVELEAPMLGNPEVLAARGDVLYRMSDTNGPPSFMARYRCR
ncbi:MAG TPA: hypothetical protein VFQ53_41405 [Kofleriaceae bacterium]|nr:hypothetical protein [Kofleriaceae bacterium]